MSRNKTGKFQRKGKIWKGKILLALVVALLMLSGCQDSDEQAVKEKIAEVESAGNAAEEGGAQPAKVGDEDTKKLYDEQEK